MGRVGSGRVGSGRVGSAGLQTLTRVWSGRVSSDHHVFKLSRAGSGQHPYTRPDLTRQVCTWYILCTRYIRTYTYEEYRAINGEGQLFVTWYDQRSQRNTEKSREKRERRQSQKYLGGGSCDRKYEDIYDVRPGGCSTWYHLWMI